MSNYRELTVKGLLQQFSAEQDMALLQNCQVLQVCVGKCVS